MFATFFRVQTRSGAYEALLAQLITLQNVTVVSKLPDSNPTSHHIVAELSWNVLVPQNLLLMQLKAVQVVYALSKWVGLRPLFVMK